MPHLKIEYSQTLAARVDMAAICDRLRLAMLETEVFPLAGIRVRAYCADASSIADNHPDNAFAHLQLRMGQGRNLEVRQRAGEAIFEVLRDLFAEELKSPHFALSLEIVEIESDTSWKANPMHKRLSKPASD